MFYCSDDDCPEENQNDYQDLNSSGGANNTGFIQPMPILNYPTRNYTKHRDLDLLAPSPLNRTPERSVRGSTIHTPIHCRDNSSNINQEEQCRTQVGQMNS